MASNDVTQTTSLPSTHLSSNLDFPSYTFDGGLDENIRDEKSDLSVRAFGGDGGADLSGECDGFVSGLWVKLPVSTDDGLSGHIKGSLLHARHPKGRCEGSCRTSKGEEGKSGELHGAMVRVYGNWIFLTTKLKIYDLKVSDGTTTKTKENLLAIKLFLSLSPKFAFT